MKTSVTTIEAPAAIGPYSQAVRHGDLLWCSGALGLDPNSGSLVEGGVGPQAEQALNNLEAICREGGTSLDKAVRCTVYLTDLADFQTVNALYAARFEEPFPARVRSGKRFTSWRISRNRCHCCLLTVAEQSPAHPSHPYVNTL